MRRTLARLRSPSLPRVGSHAVLAVVVAFSLLPLVWMVTTAVKPPAEVVERTLLPSAIDFSNVSDAFDALPIGSLLLNTTAMALAITVGQLLTSLLAAYAFGCWRFRGEKVLFVLFVASWMVPFQVVMIPNYALLAELGWLNHLVGVIVPQLAAAFGVMLLRQHLRSFPRDLLDAARMDGLGAWRTLWRVVVPNLRGPLAALTILLFISAWNEYLWPLLVMQQDHASVIQIGLKGFLSEVGNDYGALMAAAGILSLPVFLIYVVLQRQVVDAFVRSGLR